MSIQDIDDSNYCILVIFNAFRTKFEAIEKQIDTTIKALKDLREKMDIELTDIDGVIAKIQKSGGSQDER